ncbi:MAG TPA: hypothetical protein DDY77_02490 [Clostridiales bacterium]|nr:hypothetical protein [Clostridiales bacterium]
MSNNKTFIFSPFGGFFGAPNAKQKLALRIFTSIFYREFASYVKIFIYVSFVAYNLLKSNYAESA